MARKKSNAQPVRAPTGGDYGARRQLEAAQSVEPLPDNRALPAISGGGGGQQAPQAPVARPDVFGPTQRADEPLTAGAPMGAGPNSVGTHLPDDPVEFLRAVQMEFPSPGLARLLERAARKQVRGGM